LFTYDQPRRYQLSSNGLNFHSGNARFESQLRAFSESFQADEKEVP